MGFKPYKNQYGGSDTYKVSKNDDNDYINLDPKDKN
jgi:predicted esterase